MSHGLDSTRDVLDRYGSSVTPSRPRCAHARQEDQVADKRPADSSFREIAAIVGIKETQSGSLLTLSWSAPILKHEPHIVWGMSGHDMLLPVAAAKSVASHPELQHLIPCVSGISLLRPFPSRFQNHTCVAELPSFSTPGGSLLTGINA